MVIGGINEDGTETNSVEVLPLDGGFLLACEKHWPVPKTIVQGVGGLYNGELPIVCATK